MPNALPNEPEKLEVRQQANLAFFVHDRFSYALEQFKKVHSLPQTAAKFVTYSLLESYLWLSYGVAVDYFPSGLSRRVVYEHFPLILNAYESILAAGEVDTWFSPLLRGILESEFNGGRPLFSSVTSSGKYSELLFSVFDSVLLLANGFAEQPGACQLLQAIAFEPNASWEKSFSAKSLADTVHNFESVEEPGLEGEPEHWTLPGFFASLDFMERFRQIQNDFEQSEMFKQETTDFYDFLDSLKEVQQWRLNFGYAVYRQRFLDVAELAARTYIRRIPKQEVPDVDAALRTFLKSVGNLITDWGAPAAAIASGA